MSIAGVQALQHNPWPLKACRPLGCSFVTSLQRHSVSRTTVACQARQSRLCSFQPHASDSFKQHRAQHSQEGVELAKYPRQRTGLPMRLPPFLNTLAGTAATVGCLLALPAFADTAAQSVEQVAKQLASGDGAIGSLGNEAFREGLISGFLLILFSELGDKTFFIAVLLALKKNKGLVFAGTFGALAVMTVISVVLGQALHQVDELLPSSSLPFDDIAAAFLLVFFGIRTLQEAGEADTASMDEEQAAQEEVERLDSGAATGLLLSTFALVFAAEWGDKSFLATIALSAASSPVGVTTGAVAGHGVATLIAVLGGSVLGKYLNEKVVQYVGGSLFLVFAGATVLDIVRTMST